MTEPLQPNPELFHRLVQFFIQNRNSAVGAKIPDELLQTPVVVAIRKINVKEGNQPKNKPNGTFVLVDAQTLLDAFKQSGSAIIN